MLKFFTIRHQLRAICSLARATRSSFSLTSCAPRAMRCFQRATFFLRQATHFSIFSTGYELRATGRIWRHVLRATCYVLFLALMACNVPQAIVTATRKTGEGTFVLFLNGPSKTPFSMTLELATVEVVRADGISHPILNQSRSLDSLNLVERQIVLSETFLPEGRYREIRVRIPKAQIRRDGQAIDLAVPPEGFTFNTDFEIKAGEATPLFMSWNVEESIEREVFLRPAFAFNGRDKELRAVLAYVTNEGSNTVTVIDRSMDRVIDVIEVGIRPKGIVISPDASRAFIVNSGSNNLTILDVKNNQVLHTANLEIGANPSELAIHPDGRTLYVANTALNSVSVIDATSFQTIELIPVGQRPIDLAVDPTGARVLVANMGANTLSIIDTNSNRVVTTIPVEFQPISVSFDANGTRAFVCHLRSPRMIVLALSGLRTEGRVNTGPATAVLPDGISRRVFVAQVTGNRLGLFDPTIDAELASVPVGKEPNRLALDVDREKVYVVNRGSDSVTVVDRNTRLVRTEIPTSKRPFGIAIAR